MEGRGRILTFLLVNVVVSALTTMLVIRVWLRNSLAPQTVATPTSVAADDGAASDEQTAQPTATTAPAAVSSDVQIVTIFGAGDYANERLQVRYSGEDELSLAGWQLYDEDGNTFVFPGLTMFSEGQVVIYTSSGIDTVVELHWGLPEAAWSSGEIATLVDQAGDVRATYQIP